MALPKPGWVVRWASRGRKRQGDGLESGLLSATLAPGYCLSFGEVLRAELTQDRKTKIPKATINNKTKKEKKN
ncbi:hypothetical protein I79_013827 [Cricetulus griseus]|uniref:Uncharacterized protein n=1 Tax=Cricetulus griseus TaxID=10029 RepID=G3HSJ4_CRIGR|nr:hypothetical protein I79_013827 [Cricetulus griseus]